MYTYTGTGANGCPDNYTLDLTINTSTNNPTQIESACDSYTWSVDGNTYTASGIYTYTGTGANGCPDNYTLDLTINTSTNNPTQVETACDSYTWSVDGNTYTASGIYTYTTTGQNGCPDNYTLDLTINTSTNNPTQVETACDSYTWSVDGNTYTASGMYTYTGTGSNGCPDNYTLDLTINTSTNNPTQVETACDSYTWSVDGNTYTASGMYTYTGTGANGCPDNYTLDLTINTSTNNPTQVETACDSYTWSVDGNTYTASGMYTYTGTGANGCPDNYTLDLTINTATNNPVQTVTACNTYTWSVDGNTYTTSGMYTYTGTGANGCPDNYTLDLTITTGTAVTVTASDVTACVNAIVDLTSAVSPAGGTFSVANPYTGPSSAATIPYTYTYTDPGGCTGSATANMIFTSVANVTNFMASSIGGTTVVFTWDNVAGAAWYTLRYREVGTTTWTYKTSTSSPKTVTGLTAGTDYEFEIRANCSSTSPGNYGSNITVSTNAGCPTPVGLAASNVTASNATISWTPSAGALWYNIRFRPVGSTTWVVYSAPASATITLTGLMASTQYEYQVLAKCANNDISGWSILENFTTTASKNSQVEEVSAETFVANITVYPNPVRNILNVEVTATAKENTTVKVFDMSGRLVKQLQANTEVGVNNLSIDLSDVSNGLYSVQVYANDNLTHISKVNKQD
ncbi:MAG: fibronectin type III domain-containing protein [Chitinophagaceae bacterium]